MYGHGAYREFEVLMCFFGILLFLDLANRTLCLKYWNRVSLFIFIIGAHIMFAKKIMFLLKETV